MNLRVIIAEDEAPARNKLKAQLATIKSIELVAEAKSGLEALTLIEEHQPQLLLMDIEMPHLSGLDVLDALTYQPYIIFTTAYSKFAIDAFNHDTIDYLLKPFPLQRLKAAIEKAEKRIKLIHNSTRVGGDSIALKRLVSKCDDRMAFIDLNDIYFIKSEQGSIIAHTEKGIKPLQMGLDQLEQKLNPDQFLRLHRSYLINLDRVSEIQRYLNGKLAVIIDDEQKTTLISSRSGADRLKMIFEQGS
ncbi:LytTR family DNA-binding domain-containing protein [Microbulbifer sp. VAAF005]|uniref:LytR/AlgR family response regulator transcription factor n=1 Tax=Microbulbifer sp. VAAF005 TaxID=3034230 RepID=UPI0024AD5EC6|nr:LytTR family DNA-binding domain-containing protein [Microbulbifer sp. VAAF005]WHI45865.1 LytTR family DNA-binding domain-containing protein [Microbulbifer sp. VAAF005]